MNQVLVRCSDPNVVCESRKVQQGEPHDVFLKVIFLVEPALLCKHVSSDF